MAAHHPPDVTMAAAAGMISEANERAIEAAGLSFILGMKIPDGCANLAPPGHDVNDLGVPERGRRHR